VGPHFSAFLSRFQNAERKHSNVNARGEFEAPVVSPEPDISTLGEKIAADVVRILWGAPLLAHFTTQMKRRALISSLSVEIGSMGGIPE